MEHEQTSPEQRQEGETAPRRRRGRTTLLIAGAAVLGVLAGTVTGYAVQYHRAPTALPPLAQQGLVAPKPLAPDDTTTHRTINANRWHKSDDDLSKLLLEAPSGAKPIGTPGYMGLDSLAALYERPDKAFAGLQDDGFRRAVSTAWEQGDRYTEIQLMQYKDRRGAVRDMGGASDAISEDAGNPGSEIAGLPPADAHVWVFSQLTQEDGYHPLRQARAVVRRGDVVAEIFYTDAGGAAISENDIIDLAKRQLERL
ncbi:hypothetical protein [Streptomyces sp. NBC_01408]|uniref:hypothetical protein n=1 Tax=Streptomyces sp. NBC_01408 TaxID=2903855 RepID=UPI0022519C8D|nr:hypothetical protein [Streptomyces sp. NBC_01408]MCX4691943.1 hypothetical protein [Streptomyces sp. NBC_01408]